MQDYLAAAAATEPVGWLAAALTLACFASSQMLWLRVLALAANVAFATYAWHATLAPVLLLHLSLAPVNAWRLSQVLRQRYAELTREQTKPRSRAAPQQPWWGAS